jgi:type I restriction enzyme S subunit
VGIAALVEVTPPPIAFPDTMIRVCVSDSSMLKRLFVLLWNSPSLRPRIRGKAKTTAGIYKVNQEDIGGTPIPLPPAGEQERLLAVADRQLSASAALAASLATSCGRAARLRQSILKWAFEGKLVEQDPNDQPASVLLELIRAERAAAGTPKARGRKKRSAN